MGCASGSPTQIRANATTRHVLANIRPVGDILRMISTKITQGEVRADA
jgi:hypothetical protein